jgi:sugar (pentulose or hexulose) kinase
MHVIAIDVGTSGVKAVHVGAAGAGRSEDRQQGGMVPRRRHRTAAWRRRRRRRRVAAAGAVGIGAVEEGDAFLSLGTSARLKCQESWVLARRRNVSNWRVFRFGPLRMCRAITSLSHDRQNK